MNYNNTIKTHAKNRFCVGVKNKTQKNATDTLLSQHALLLKKEITKKIY